MMMICIIFFCLVFCLVPVHEAVNSVSLVAADASVPVVVDMDSALLTIYTKYRLVSSIGSAGSGRTLHNIM